ncbi:MAG: DMT family transporter [Thermoleophilia bacterium]
MRAAGGRPSLLPFAFLAGTVTIWGTSYWPTAVAGSHTNSLVLGVLRTAPSALLLLALVPILGGRFPRGRMLAWALVTSGPMIALFYWGATDAIARAGPGNGAVLVNTIPLWVALLGWLLLKERLALAAILGLVVGFGGVVLMVSSQLGGSDDTGQLLLGMGLALVVALGWTGGTLLLKRLGSGGDLEPIGFTAAQFVGGSIILVPIAFAIEGTSGTDWGSGEMWGAAMWIGPGNAIGAILFYMALAKLPASQTASALFLVPAVAVIVEIARGNAPTAVVLVGMALTVIGVALVSVPSERLSALVGALLRRPAREPT